MAKITKEQLRKEIASILKDADLNSMSTNKVLAQLEEKFDCELNSRKPEIKVIVKEIINEKADEEGSSSEDEGGDDDEEEEEDDEDDEEDEPPAKKRASTARKASPAKKKKAASDEDASEGEENEGDSDYDEKPKKAAAAKGKKRGGRRKKGSDSDSDEDWKQPKKPKKGKAAAGGKPKGTTGFTRPYTLSADLASVVGAESLPRYEVVKKIWSLIKERNLYDPKNKQFAICDNELMKIFGVKRFRTFSMLKYLKPHFLQ